LAACVDETPINTGDYIAGSAVGNKAELGFQDPVGLKGISAVSARAWVSKSDTADRSVIARLKSSGSSVASAAYSIPTAMTRLDVTSEVDPSTGLPWTVAGLAGASWELEVAA
jgi:hypothetical protein